MYYLNGEPLRLDKAFVDADGNQYPANWLRNSTQEQRDALGVTWVQSEEATGYDKRFYHGVNEPKDVDQLKQYWVSQQKTISASLLTPTDWYIVRMAEDPSSQCPPDIAEYRASVRAVSGQREEQILACADTDELALLIGAPAMIQRETGYEVNPGALAAWPELSDQ